MKKLALFSISVFLLCFSNPGFSQAPSKFNYQAVARDASGGILSSQAVSVRISVLQGSATGTALYSEEHSVTTNAFGQLSLQIGTGTNTSGSLSGIDWAGDDHYLQVEFDETGGTSFTVFSTTQLVSVPYAMVANSAVNDNVDDADADPANEIQTISLSGDTITLSGNGGSVALPAGFDGDFSSLTNVPTGLGDGDDDQQSLSVSGSDLTISNGNTVTLPDSDQQSLSLSGNDLTISNGNTVTLPGSSVGGSDQEVLFNNNGTEDGSGMLYDPTTGTFAIGEDPYPDYLMYNYRGSSEYGPDKTNIYAWRNGTSGSGSGGLAWSIDSVDAGVKAYSYWGNAYSAAIAGYSYFDYGNSAAIIGGDQDGSPWGALGYQTSGFAMYAGYFNGNVGYTGTLSQVSDARLKTNIQSLSGALSLVKAIDVKTYHYKKGAEANQLNLAAGKQYGFIAQQLETVVPELVSADFATMEGGERQGKEGPITVASDAYKTVNYIGMVPILTQAIKEQQEIIESMQSTIDQLQARINALEGN